MKLTGNAWFDAERRMGLKLGQGLAMVLGFCLMAVALGGVGSAQAVSTTTVQGTVYLASGQAGAGTVSVSWPAFTTATGQSITAGHTIVTISPDGFLSVNLAPNVGATPAGLYYTAVYQMSDGTTSTQYWVVPAAAQASLGAVQAQVMPAAQAVQAVSKSYVDESIAEASMSQLSAAGGTLNGSLYLNGDPTQPSQAADKHYVDSTFSQAVPLAGGKMTGGLVAPAVNGMQAPAAGSPQATIQAAVSAAGTSGAVEIPAAYAGTDSFTNPNGVYVRDLRQKSSQQFERSVKEFGAVCDGVTDDTSALQSAINYAETHGASLTIPQGTCKTRTLVWHGESIGGFGKQVSALMGFPGQDVLATAPDSVNLLRYTRLHDLTIYVDQSVDVSCSAAAGRMPAGSCALNRPVENNSILSPGGNGFSGTKGSGAAWAVGNCAIAMPALTGAGGNGLQVAELENLEIVATGVDPMAAQYPGAHSTHTCGLYLAQWPQWSEFRNIDINGLNTGIAIPALPGTTPAGLMSDSNRWDDITIHGTHGFTAAAGSHNVLDNVVVMAGNSAATGEPPTGLVLDFAGTQQGWIVRTPMVNPSWNAVQPQLTVTATGGAVSGVTVGSEHGVGFDPYGTQVPLAFSGSCSAQATATVNSNGSIGTVAVTQGGVGCSGTTTASVNVTGSWDTAAPVNLISGQNMSLFGGNLLHGTGGYTVWNAAGSQSYGTQLAGGGGTLPGGGSYSALVANSGLGSSYPVDQFPGVDFGAKLQACLGTVNASYGGTCDARNFSGTLQMGSSVTISTANATVLLPCATISTANQLIVTAGTRNATLHGCSLRGASTASGSQGGTVFLYSGTGAMVQVGDPTYAADTMGFHMDNAVINTTGATSAAAQGLAAYRTQELDIESLYFLGNQNQTGMTLDGTGNYTGGSFTGDQFGGFQTAVNAVGHQKTNAATTDWMNASTFVRLHIDCPTSGGSPIAGTIGINLQQGDGNTFTGGDVEGCSTALHLGANGQNNTIVGLRNENSTNQVVADAGSSYNNWMTGGTMFTGQLTDNGTRNSFLDTFHRSFNGLNGDWYGSQKDATVTNHVRLGTGVGNERGLLNEIQTDYGYRWTEGYTDATAGEQYYQVQDVMNNVNRLSIGQYNNGQSSTNNQTVLNAAGTGAVVLNGSNNSGTGGVVIGSGGPAETTVATVDKMGNAQFNGTLQVGGASTFINTPTAKNQVDAEVDATLWAGLTQSQKESLIYKDWNGNSQWYMEKDANNNWELNSATGGLDSFKAYQSSNSGDTYINASNGSGAVRVNYETGAGTAFKVYGGGSGSLYASFTAPNAIEFPGLAATSGANCLQVDNSGYITNTGAACGTGNGNGSVNSANAGQIAYYTANGSSVGGLTAVPITAGGTGAANGTAALQNLGGVPSTTTVNGHALSSNVTLAASDLNTGTLPHTQLPALLSGDIPDNAANTLGTAGNVTGTVGIGNGGTGASTSSGALKNVGVGLYSVKNYGAKGDGTTDDTTAIKAALADLTNAKAGGFAPTLYFPAGTYIISATLRIPSYTRVTGEGYQSSTIQQTCGTCNLLTVYNNGTSLQGSYFGGSVSEMTLEGSGHTTTGTLLELQNTGGYNVHDVMFYNHGGRGMTVGQGSERSKFTNIFMEGVRWPEVLNGFEFHTVGLTINAPGGTAELAAPPGYSAVLNYCYGLNCVNGVFPEPGGQPLVSVSGNGTTQSYVLSGTSPVLAGHSVYFSGITGNAGYNGYYLVASATNNTPTNGQFTLAVSGSASGTATLTGATFAVALRPDNQHGAVWSGLGHQQSFEDGEIKPIVYLPAFKFASVNGTRLDHFYMEGYIDSVNPSVIVGGLPDQLIGTGTLTTGTVGNPTTNNTTPTTYSVVPVQSTIWWPAYVNDPNDIPAVGGAYHYPVWAEIFCPDFVAGSTSPCAANPSVQKGQFEVALVMASSDGNAYLVSRNLSGSTAPSNTAWVNPVIDYDSADGLTTGGGLLMRQNQYSGDYTGSLAAGFTPYCVDATANQCAEVEDGPMPDGYAVHYGSTSTDTTLTNLGMVTIQDNFAGSGALGGIGTAESTGNGWIKVSARGVVDLAGQFGSGASESGEIGTLNAAGNAMTLSTLQIAAMNYNGSSGPLASLQVENGNSMVYSGPSSGWATGIPYFEQSLNVADANLASPGGQPGSGNMANGRQFANSSCSYDVGAGTTSGATAHALNRFCYKGSPILTGTSAGWEYDTWNGSAWVNAFSIAPNSGGTSGTIGGYIGSTIPSAGGSVTYTGANSYTANTTTFGTIAGGHATIDQYGQYTLYNSSNAQLSGTDEYGDVIGASFLFGASHATNNGSLHSCGAACISALGANGSGYSLFQALHFQSETTATVTAGSGAGSGASATISGSDFAGSVNVTAGSAPAAGAIATVTFGSAYTAAPNCVVGTNASPTYLGVGWTPSASTLTITTAVAIPGGVTKLSYHCGQ